MLTMFHSSIKLNASLFLAFNRERKTANIIFIGLIHLFSHDILIIKNKK